MNSLRVLLLPLSNVLGHLTRTLALAEEFSAQGHEVHIATDGCYDNITKVLPPGIEIHSTAEMASSTSRAFGAIVKFEPGLANDLANLLSANALDHAELSARGEQLKEMVRRDAQIIERIRPDVIITDYRFTITLLPKLAPKHVFHLSHVLGYPSLYRRVRGQYFCPLDSAHILVPGLPCIEHTDEAGPLGETGPGDRGFAAKMSWCGHFPWAGWSRLFKDVLPPPRADVLLCFGSTGNAPNIVPWMLRTIPEQVRLNVLGYQAPHEVPPNVHCAPFGDLERYLDNSDMVFCHGGHGTVMECIAKQKPMVIFAHNIEQLEIGRRIEALHLGILVKTHYAQLDARALGSLIENIRSDELMKQNLQRYAELLASQNGPQLAVAAVLGQMRHEQTSTDLREVM